MSENETWFKVSFKQKQPIHIGYNKYGVINETRIFIPGQTMWGALTNAYFKKTGKHNKELFENISCFYPVIRNKVLSPRFEDGEFFLGDFSEKEFRKEFVTTYLSTSINPKFLSAKDESLHEIDVILPKEGIEWEGYVKCDEEKLKQIDEIYIGGDVRYGFGLMKMGEPKKEQYDQNPKKGIIIDTNKNKKILTNFLVYKNQKFEGRLELLLNIDFFQKKKIDPENNGFLCVSVGSKIYSN